MKTKREKLLMRLVAFLCATAMALLMIWSAHFVKADETGVPDDTVATLTDATDTDVGTTTESVVLTNDEGVAYIDPVIIPAIDLDYNVYKYVVKDYNRREISTSEENQWFNNAEFLITDTTTGVDYWTQCIDTNRAAIDPDIRTGDLLRVKCEEWDDAYVRKILYYSYVSNDYYWCRGGLGSQIWGDTSEASIVAGAMISHYQTGKPGYDTSPDPSYRSPNPADNRIKALGFYNFIQNAPAAPVGGISITQNPTTSVSNGIQKTSDITITGDSNHTVYVYVDSTNIGLYKYNADGSATALEVKSDDTGTTHWYTLSGGDKFYLTAPVNKNETVSYKMTTSAYITQVWHWTPAYYDEGFQDMVSFNVDSSTAWFEVPWEGTGSLELYKVSDNTRVTANNSCYSLKGATYKLKCSDGSYLKDSTGNDITLVTDANGYAKVDDLPAGTYTLEEIKASPGYTINVKPVDGDVTVTPGTVTTVNTVETPGTDPVQILLAKKNNANKPLQGAVYKVTYYKGVQTANTTTLSQQTPSDTWYLVTDSEGWIMMDDTYLATSLGYTSSAFYLDENDEPAFPLGSVMIEEERAPFGYQLSTVKFGFKVVEYTGPDGKQHVKAVGADGQDIFDWNETTGAQEDEPYLFVDLTLRKVNTDTNPAQGNTGDVSLEGAVFALYAKRDIMDIAANEVAVKGGQTYTTRTALKFADGTPVVDAYGNQMYGEVGDPIPVVIFDPTDANGESTVTGLIAANNADDYYVRELVAPKGFKRNTNDTVVDLRDNTDKTVTVDAIKYKYDITNSPDKQPVQVYKYELVEDNGVPSIETVNGVEFQIYLISSLKNREDAVKFTQGNTVVYDFTNYDFSGETPVVVKADGSTKLVTGSTGIDGYDETIDLYYGEYVLVETKTLDRLEPVSPKVFSIPKYKTDANGKVLLDNNGDPQKFAYCDLNVLNIPTEKYLKIDKVNEEGELVLHNNATFSIWDVSDLDASKIATIEDIKANGTQITQYQQTVTGMVPVTEFSTNDEGFLVLFEAFKYGDYAIIEEKAPTGYSLSKEPVIFRVRSEAVYLMMNGNWEECTVYKDATDREYWEVSVTNVDYEINAAKVDYDTGDFVPNAEMTIYRAVDAEGNIALDENTNPIILEAENEAGDIVQAIWNTSDTWVQFNAVPEGYYLIRETKTPEGYATRDDLVVYVGENPDVAVNGTVTVTGDSTLYYSFTKRDGGVDWIATDSIDVDTVKVNVAIPNKEITVEISKINAATEGELPGAELTLYRITDDGDEEIETWTSTDKAHVVKGLTPGWYKLYENTVPLGFYTEKNTIEFEILDTEEVQKCEMINHPIVLDISKESFNAGTPVEGATLALYRVSEGPWGSDELMDTIKPLDKATDTDATATDATEGLQLVDRWLSDGELHTITGLYPGEYRLVEEVTPHGYTSAQSIDFTITDQSSCLPVVMYDEPIECKIKIHKTGESLIATEVINCEYGEYNKLVWEDTDLKGVKFDVLDEEGNLVTTIVTDEYGVAVTEELEFGKYTIKEHVPAGMVDDDIVYKVEFTWMQGMSETSLVASVEIYNESCNTQINISKVGESPIFVDGQYVYTQTPLDGVLFGVYAQEDVLNYYGEIVVEAGTCVGYAVTDSNGIASVNEKLIKGRYYYQELKTAGVQYVADTTQYPFELILENSKIDIFNVNNEFPIVNKFVQGEIQVYKIAQDGKVPLAGAEFDLYNSDDVVVQHLVTDGSGKATSMKLPYGKYYLKETKAPDTYQKVDTKFEAAVTKDGVTTIVTIENSKTPKLGATTMITVAVLVVVLLISLTILYNKLRKKRV